MRKLTQPSPSLPSFIPSFGPLTVTRKVVSVDGVVRDNDEDDDRRPFVTATLRAYASQSSAGGSNLEQCATLPSGTSPPPGRC